MLRIGLTGGIASGKSVAAHRFAWWGATVIDHDDLSRNAVAPGSAALADIAREFGGTLIVSGELDRSALAELVFNDQEALGRLNAIIHPYVYALADAADRQARVDGAKVIVHDVPLLVETDQAGKFDIVVTVAAPKRVRLARLVEGRGLSLEQAEGRIASQANDEERAALSDVVLDGSGSVVELEQQVDRFWRDHIPMSHGRTNVDG
jgi:dephospho-CoA kinase